MLRFSVLCLVFFFCTALLTATPHSEPRRYRESEKAWQANETRRSAELVLHRLDTLLQQRAICTAGVTYIGVQQWLASEDALTLAVTTMRARGWNMTLESVWLGGYTADSFLLSTGPCHISQRVEPEHCYASLDECGNAKQTLVFDGQWWLGFMVCYQQVQLIQVTL